MLMGHTTPTQERNQGHQKVSCELQATGQPTVRADRPAHSSRAHASRPSTPPAEGEQEGRELAKGRGREASTRALGRGPEGYGRFCSYTSEHGEPKRGTGTSGEFVTSGIRCLKHPVATGSGEGRALFKGWGQKPASHPTLRVHTGGGHAHPLWPRDFTAATLHIHGHEASEQLPSQQHPSGTSDLGNHFEGGVDGQPVWGLLSA